MLITYLDNINKLFLILFDNIKVDKTNTVFKQIKHNNKYYNKLKKLIKWNYCNESLDKSHIPSNVLKYFRDIIMPYIKCILLLKRLFINEIQIMKKNLKKNMKTKLNITDGQNCVKRIINELLIDYKKCYNLIISNDA